MAADPVKTVIDGACSFCEEPQAALDENRITEEQWYRYHEKHFSSLYPAAENPRGQSGNGGDEARYWCSQEMIRAAITGSGTFLDVGCANGYLREKIAAWSLELGYALECHGQDWTAGLIDLARRRLKWHTITRV
jgi:2-polyprenyl-3-methyl-5-hydroxy-6-metoxy-1,4-benzoquinol methylase